MQGSDKSVFLRKKRKKHSLCRKLCFEIEDPGRGGVEAWADSKKLRFFLPNFVLPLFIV